MKAKWKEKVQNVVVGACRLRETLTWSISEGKSTREFLSRIETSFKLTNSPEPQKVRSETDKEEIRESKKLS